MRRTSVAILVLALAASLAACGDDDDDDEGAGGGGSGEALTQAAYVQQANGICQRTTDEIATLFETGGFPVLKSEVPAFVDRVSPIVTRNMNELNELEPPEAEEAKLKAFRDAAKDRADAFQRAAEDDAEGQKLFDEEGGWDPLREAAEAYGQMPACAAIDEEGEEEASDKVDPATLSPEKRAYVSQVDARCTAAAEEDQAIEEDVFGEGFPPEIDQWAEGLPRFAALTRTRLASFRQITPPAADKAAVDQLIADLEGIATELEKAAVAAAARNEAELAPILQALFPRFDEFDAKLRQFGFQVCGSEQDLDEEDGEDGGEEEGDTGAGDDSADEGN